MECINKNSKEFKELEKATGLSPIALSYEISKYQQMTGKEDFPSQEYLEKVLDPVSKKMMIDIDRHANEFYGSIDNNFLDAIFINSMGRNSQLSVAIEKAVRKQMSMVSQATDIPVKYIHSRTQVLPSKEIDGVLVVNLAAVNENTTFEELIKPIKEFINIESINEQTVNISMVSNNSDTVKKEENSVINNDNLLEVKEGVKELFDENPELANSVYEALGFNQLITPNDRVVFGHPTIGKSFLKNQGDDKFISLDDDYAAEINDKVKEIADKYNVTTYQVKDGGTQKWNNEYNQMMQEMFNVAKQRAVSEGKTLFTSNTNLLRNNAESFDKVINLTDKEFERRIQERGAKYDTKEWKSQINEAISKLPSNKVINTDKYLSDLFITPQQKQQAQQLYSQYLDTIFPDSKVKDIVYHGSPSKFEKFDREKSKDGTTLSVSAQQGLYFATNIDNAEYYKKINDLHGEDDFYNKRSESIRNAELRIWDIKDELDKNINNTKRIDIEETFTDLEYDVVKLKDGTYGFISDSEYTFLSKEKYEFSKNDFLKRGGVLKSKLSSGDTFIDFYDDENTNLINELLSYFKIAYPDKNFENITYLPSQFKYIYEDLFLNFKYDYNPDRTLYRVILDVKKPNVVDLKHAKRVKGDYVDINNESIEKGNDSSIILNTKDPLTTDLVIVFEPEQVHILGSKADIEGFNEFKENTTPKENVKSKPVEVKEPVSIDLKTKISDTLELETSDEIQVYSLPNGQVFKTAEEREIYTRNLLKSNGIEQAVIDKFIANNYALSKLAVRNREIVKNLLEDTVQELKNNLKIESYDYGDNNSKALFDQSPLGQRVQESFDKVLTNQKARGKAKTRRTTDKTTFELDSIALEKSEEPNPNLEKSITEQIESYTRAFDKISRDFHMKYTNELSDSFMQYRNSEYSVTDESANTALEKARIIGDKLNVLVKLDNSIPGRGVLLSTSHYLSRNAGKPVILINPDFLTSDTVIHEFGHLYIELLGGIKDPKVQKAIELLQNTKFYDNVKNMYPELSKEELDLEALATAIGFEGDSIFTRDVEKLSFWQSLVRAFIEALKKIFKFSTEDAITSLAKEVIGQSKRRVPKGMLYKNNRNQFSKYFIDPEIEENNRQAAISELFEKIDNAITLDEESHTYHHLGEELVHSITTVAKAMSSRHKADENKGSFNIPFNKEIINENNILMTLKQPVIPFALARALDNYVFSEIPGVVVNFKMTIHDRSWVDAFNRALNDIDLEIENENNFIQGLKDNFEEILNEAERIDTTFNRSSIAGNIVHDAAEKYVHKLVGKGGEVFPENIKNSEKFILQIKDIIDKGISEGSVFFTEQSLYDEGTRRPGKADLIEITKDGRYRIYDFKTIKSFTRNGHDKSMRELYVSKGYMHQLIAYGQILKKYGIEPAENPYNILMTEVSFDDDLDTNKEVTLGKFKMQSMTDPKLLSEFTEAEGKIRRSFSAGNNLTDINKEEDIKNLDDVANRIAKAVKVYDKNLAPKSILGTEFIKNLKEVLDSEADKEKMKELRNDYNRYVALNNTVVVKSFIEKIHEVMTVVVMHNENDIDTSSEYLRSVKYVIQMAETLNDIKKMITHDELVKDNKLTETQALGLIQLVDETLQMIHDSNRFYKDKLIRSAIALLAHNSNQSEGALIETLTIEARKKGGRDGKGTNDKFEINKYVQSNIKKRKESLYSNERAYWEAQYSNGLLDLRLAEALIGDPGMLRSQVIQVVKNMMDSNAMGVRTQMLELAPEIDEFNSKMKGINPDGNTHAQWGRFVVKRDIYIPQLDKTENMLSGVIMPEFISDRYLLEEEYFFKKKNLVAKQQFIASKKAYKNQQDDLATIQEELNELHEELKNKRKKLSTDKKIKNPDLKRVNPEFAKLSDVDKEALRYIHQKLDNSDELIEDRSKRLGMTIKGGTTLRQLPKQRMSAWEATGAGKLLGDLKSKFQDLKRPPADEDEMAFQAGENHGSDYDGAIRTDLKGNPIYDVPVFYRNELEDPRLQSYDIPTLLLENHETSLVHNQNKLLEADLFIIQDSVSSENQKIIKSDNLINKKLKDLSGEYSQISEANHLHKALVSFIDNRLYKRAFSGVFTKQNYRLVKGMNTVTKYASLVSLTLNFKSALSTTLQGTMLRMVEGWAGEYFNMNDWKNGTRKTYADLADVIKDTQNHIPKSKTNLLIKKFGMEPRSNALINKFVQDTLVKKNMDSNALYAVTSIAENNVTSMLMYTLLSSVKVMDKNQNFIDKDGNIVSDEKDAMSLDEAYTVENGKLVLHPKVYFTTQSLINPYKEDSDTGYLASTEISSKMQHIYADMYGQYNEELKSQLQRTAIGKMVMSMKGWLPRGINRRFRGITTSIPFSDSFLTFDEMRDEKNRDKRYYVQALKQYQEGYYTTGLRYLGSLIKELKNNTNKLGAASSVYNSMTTHEKANIKRTMADIAVAILTTMMYKLLAAWAKSMGDDDPETSERLYFAALMTFRLHDELYTFMSPNSMISIVKNPAVAFNSLSNVSNIVDSVFGWEIDNQGDIDFNINNTYEKGSKKGNYKSVEGLFKILPGVNNSRQAGALMGMDTGKSMEDAFKAQIMMDKQK